MAPGTKRRVRKVASDSVMYERNRLVRQINPGEFWKPCPGTTAGYLCCGYQILSPVLGCGMYCRYCALQAYFKHQRQVRFTNLKDMAREVERKVGLRQGRVIRLGTGEFADSLYLETELGMSVRVARLLERYDNVLAEFKTKSVNIDALRKIRDPSKVVVGFSMNTPRMVRLHERGTASIAERLNAARQCEHMGFWVSFHFDPILWYPQWEGEYRELVDRVFGALRDPGRIAWWSLGAFRSVVELKSILRTNGRHLDLFSGEMVLGADRKLRYIRTIRTEFFAKLQHQVEKHSKDVILYLCMESPEVWRDAGMEKRIPGGLVRYLDRRAETMLGMSGA